MNVSWRKKTKRFFKAVLRKTTGLEIKKVKTKFDWVRTLGVKTIIDIGSNEGQFIGIVNDEIKGLKWIAFEPIERVFQILKENTRNLDIEYHQNALGSKTEKLEINVNEHTPSSSLLELSENHLENFEFAQKIHQRETIEVRRLDDLVNPEKLDAPYMIKLDVQGFEDEVINGGQEVFKNARVLLIEMSFQELYQGERLFDDLYGQLRPLGFAFKGNLNQTIGKDGLFIYADSIFINENN